MPQHQPRPRLRVRCPPSGPRIRSKHKADGVPVPAPPRPAPQPVSGWPERVRPAQPDDADNSVRRIIYAFAITDEEKDAFERRFDVQLTNLYGLTEAMELVTLAPLFGDNRWPSVGLPIGEREVRVVTEDDADAAPG
ncbi:MAG: AMP-binding protein [Actinophytocola sp.]|nr:AMP-binding protein [Actinophytocola sp.]MPY86042.1 AMP-binding protein [Actinophytocola sp.]